MNVSTIQIKVKERLNKLSSNDYDNIECWQIIEAFNKAQLQWTRRQLHGFNQFKEGDEQSKRRVDDLQILLTDFPLVLTDRQLFYESTIWPTDYLEYKKVTAYAINDCCPDPRRLMLYLTEEANVDLHLTDVNRMPSFEWGETFNTLVGNKIRIYTDSKFEIQKASLMYYRKPIFIEIANCVNPYSGATSANDVNPEFKDDIVELLIDESVGIIAGDIESMNQYQRSQQEVEKNN
jgi:hypothetical protein